MPETAFHPRLILFSLALAWAPLAAAQVAEASALPEVVVNAPPSGDVARSARVGTFSEAPLRETPVSITVITHEQMQDRNIRSATEAVKYDASVQNSYNAVGLSDRLAIRGYEISTGANYRKDGLVVLGHAPVALENKEQLEVLKGLAGLQAGIAASGGVLNYVTKRSPATPVRSVTLETSERGTLYGAVDLGGRTQDGQFGYRINAATSKVRSYVKGSNGERHFASLAFDWRISPRALLELDVERLHKSQLSVPGFQLLGGTVVPRNVSARIMLNNQPWSQPVVDDVTNYGMRFAYELNDRWRTELSANHYTLRRDDAVALPINFQPNGDHGVLDLWRDNDKRTVFNTQALLQGDTRTGSVRHELTLGAAHLERKDHFADYVETVPPGQSNIRHPVALPRIHMPANPVHLRRKDQERAVFMQDVMHLNEQFKLHAGVRFVRLERDQYDGAGQHFRRTRDNFTLPNVALVYSPGTTWSLYGAYSEGLEPGGEAPAGTSNAGTTLDPHKSRQMELGLKADLSPTLSVNAALFQIKRRYEFASATNVYETAGKDRRRGLELSANGRLNRDLLLGASLTWMLSDIEGDARVAGKRIGNAPRYKAVVYGDYTLPSMPQVRLNASWQYSSSKLFAPSGNKQTRVAGHHVANLGAQYATDLNGVATTFRFSVNNVFDKFYWGDTSQTFGGFMIPGAPRTFRLSMQMDF